jgi:protein tyrosine phosphatase (PTP) superfamily phosphohydrolase (DUF442 family)
MKRLLHFLALWLWIGFAGGAVVLFVVATPLEHHLQVAGWDQHRVDLAMRALAGAWVLGSAAAAWFLSGRLRGRSAAAAHAIGLVCSVAAFAAFLRAGGGAFAAFRAGESDVGDRFVFGGYPDAIQIRALRSDGFTGVVSLLSPMVPFEAVLIGEERAAVQEAGLAFVQVPMLPWISTNEAALDTLRALARTGTGRYYVHCYLGRHRTELARYAMLEAAGVAAVPPRMTLPDSLERGPLIRVDSAVLLGPLPTRDEWFDVVVRSGTRRVIALLDPADRDDRAWIDQERAQAASSGVAFLVMPVHRRADANAVGDSVRASPLRTYVHAFRTDDRVAWVREALAAPTRTGRVP